MPRSNSLQSDYVVTGTTHVSKNLDKCISLEIKFVRTTKCNLNDFHSLYVLRHVGDVPQCFVGCRLPLVFLHSTGESKGLIPVTALVTR